MNFNIFRCVRETSVTRQAVHV